MNKRLLFTNLIVAFGVAAVPTLITMLLDGEFRPRKFVGWLVFFVALQTPFIVMSKYSYHNCTGWLRRKNT